LKAFPSLQLGDRKASGYLVDTPRSSQDNKKTEETHKTRTPKKGQKFTNIDLIDAPI